MDENENENENDNESIGVLIPTRNCVALVSEHADSIKAWLDLAREIVIVDSESKDGTIEALRERLPHPRIKILNHPPGLYQSWNFGLQNITAHYAYIATVGDSITRPGLEHLLAVAREFQSDVVISKPRCVGAGGAPGPATRWLIDEILERLKIRQPRLLSTAEQFLFAVANTWGAILGSSASNLYRTNCLKERPFPVEFGTSGDGAWGILNAFDVKIAVTPGCFSTYRHHEKACPPSDYRVESVALKLFRLAQTVVERQSPRNPLVRQILGQIRWPQLEQAINTCVVEQAKLDSGRQPGRPWFLRPGAWKARLARGQARKRIDHIIDDALVARAK